MPAKAPTTSQSGGYPVDFKYSPLEYVRILYCSFVQGLFLSSPPGAYHWDPRDDMSEIYIADESPVKVVSMGIRPAVSFTRGPVQFFSLGMDDMLDYDARTGAKIKSVLVPGTMTINCLSRVDIEAEKLAFIIAEQLWANRELMMKKGFFEIGRQPRISSPSPAGSLVQGDNSDEIFAVSVQCPYQFYRTTQITPIGAPIARGIDIALHARAALARSPGPISSPGPNPPYEIERYAPPAFAPLASDVNGDSPNPGSGPPILPTVPHPLNPAQRVVVRAFRPNSQGARPSSIGGGSIPIAVGGVTESSGKQMNSRGLRVTLVKVR
jgi:hypothetical protein